jgi:large subunit ribosomal protein L25
MHPWKMQVLHLDFQRVSRKDKITMTIPVNLIGADEAPGVTLESGIMTQGINQVEVACLAIDLPEFLSVDVASLNIGDAVHLSDLTLPEGVELSHSVEAGDEDDHSVASVLARQKPQTVVEDEATEDGAEGDTAAEGDAAE